MAKSLRPEITRWINRYTGWSVKKGQVAFQEDPCKPNTFAVLVNRRAGKFHFLLDLDAARRNKDSFLAVTEVEFTSWPPHPTRDGGA